MTHDQTRRLNILLEDFWDRVSIDEANTVCDEIHKFVDAIVAAEVARALIDAAPDISLSPEQSKEFVANLIATEVAAAVATEREACAKVADSISSPVGCSDGGTRTVGTSTQAAAAIRARKP